MLLKVFKGNSYVRYLKKISLPGFQGIPLWEIARFFWLGLINGAVTTRASAIAFNLFIAIFPMLLFLFSLIAYIPIKGFQEELLGLLGEVMPRNAFLAAKGTIAEILLKQRFDLLSIGFISMLAFATNGVNALLSAFGATYHSFKGRNWVNQYFIAMLLVCIIAVTVIFSTLVIISSRYTMDKLVQGEFVDVQLRYYILLFAQWLTALLLFFSIVAFLYYFAPYKRGKFHLFSAGTTLATLLMLISSWIFSYYINNFGQYNKLYGSIGTVIVILLWIYFNALAILIGFELNMSIRSAGKKNTLEEYKQGLLDGK